MNEAKIDLNFHSQARSKLLRRWWRVLGENRNKKLQGASYAKRRKLRGLSGCLFGLKSKDEWLDSTTVATGMQDTIRDIGIWRKYLVLRAAILAATTTTLSKGKEGRK